MDKPFLVIMVGLPGSGKTTAIKTIIKTLDRDFRIISSDAIIEDIARKSGKTYNGVFNENIKDAMRRVFNEMKNAAYYRKDVIIDATNMSIKSREYKLEIFDDYYKIAIVMNNDIERAKKNNKSRPKGRRIGDEIIESMATKYQPPSRDEGFDEVIFLD